MRCCSSAVTWRQTHEVQGQKIRVSGNKPRSRARGGTVILKPPVGGRGGGDSNRRAVSITLNVSYKIYTNGETGVSAGGVDANFAPTLTVFYTHRTRAGGRVEGLQPTGRALQFSPAALFTVRLQHNVMVEFKPCGLTAGAPAGALRASSRRVRLSSFSSCACADCCTCTGERGRRWMVEILTACKLRHGCFMTTRCA